MNIRRILVFTAIIALAHIAHAQTTFENERQLSTILLGKIPLLDSIAHEVMPKKLLVHEDRPYFTPEQSTLPGIQVKFILGRQLRELYDAKGQNFYWQVFPTNIDKDGFYAAITRFQFHVEKRKGKKIVMIGALEGYRYTLKYDATSKKTTIVDKPIRLNTGS